MLDDRELARRFPSGDDDIVRAVYTRYAGPVHTIAMAMLRDRTAAADVVQSTFLNAWRAAPRFAPDRQLGPWLYAIARRQAIDAYRRNRRIQLGGDAVPDVVELPSSIEDLWEAWEVRRAVDELPAEERAVVRMSWFEGLSHPEIAEQLDVPVGTVKSRSHRAHRRLAALLAHLDDENQTARADVVPGDGEPGR